MSYHYPLSYAFGSTDGLSIGTLTKSGTDFVVAGSGGSPSFPETSAGLLKTAIRELLDQNFTDGTLETRIEVADDSHYVTLDEDAGTLSLYTPGHILAISLDAADGLANALIDLYAL